MKNALIIHGYYSLQQFDEADNTPSNSHWIPWLSRQLMIKDIFTRAIEMPKANLPLYEAWQKEFERYDITADTVLVGHSCGAGFLVRWLGENSHAKCQKLVLVAPSLGLSWSDRTFFDFEIDGEIQNRVGKILIFVADDDKQYIHDAVKIYSFKLPKSEIISLKTGGHFTFQDMAKKEFPELLEEILR